MQINIDIGNSNFKVAALQNNEILQTTRFDKKDFPELIERVKHKNVIISNVAQIEFLELFQENCNLIFSLNCQINFPFDSEYKTMATWGMDRACNIAAARHKFPNNNVLVIDIGTCIVQGLVLSSGNIPSFSLEQAFKPKSSIGVELTTC